MAALDAMAENLETKRTFRLSYGLAAQLCLNGWEKMIAYAQQTCRMRGIRYNEERGRSYAFTLQAETYSPGWKIYHSVRLGRPESALTLRERETLRAAREMVSAAGRGSPMEIERRLHDALCARVTYSLNGHETEKQTAVGALLNGEAVCEGYADAFYLLCSLAGIPARYQGYDIRGERGGEDGHIWNLVQIGGAWVMVDTTWDDSEEYPVVYHYFNAGKDRARVTHIWRDDSVRVPWIETTREALQPQDARETPASTLQELTAATRASAGKTSFTVIPSASLRAQAKRDSHPVWDALYAAGVKDGHAYHGDGYAYIKFYGLSWWPEILEEARGGKAIRRITSVNALRQEAARQAAARATRFIVWSGEGLDLSEETSYRALNEALNQAGVSHFAWSFFGKHRVEVYDIRY